MESKYIYFRIFGYTVTILMHVSNLTYMMSHLQNVKLTDIYGEEDTTIMFFNQHQERYFTSWTFVLQIAYAVIGLTCDCLTLRNIDKKDYRLPKYLRGVRNTLFSGIQWPSSLLVSTLFWSLFYVDRALIFPRVLEKVLTRTSNHIIHTAIVPVVLWEIIFRPRTEPKSHWRNLGHMTFHYVIYFSVLFYTYFQQGVWIYPVFTQTAGTIYFPIFMIIIYILMLIYYFIQWPLTRLLHGDRRHGKSKLI